MREMQYSLVQKSSDNNNVTQMTGTKLVSIIEEKELFLSIHDIKSLYVSKLSLSFPSPHTMHTGNQTLKIAFFSATQIFPYRHR